MIAFVDSPRHLRARLHASVCGKPQNPLWRELSLQRSVSHGSAPERRRLHHVRCGARIRKAKVASAQDNQERNLLGLPARASTHLRCLAVQLLIVSAQSIADLEHRFLRSCVARYADSARLASRE